MHRTRLLVALAFAALLLGRPGCARLVVGRRRQPGLRRRWQHRAPASPTTSSSCSTPARRPVDLNGWTVQYASAASASWQTTTLAGQIPAGHYFLVQLNSAASIGAALPTPDATGTTNLAVSGGKVALVTGATCARLRRLGRGLLAAATVEDFVGYGSASRLRGLGGGGAPGARPRPIRAGAGCTDTDSNADDFVAAAPTPRNSSAPAATVLGGRASGGSRRAAASVNVDIQPVLSLALERPTISFGTAVLRRHACSDLRAGHRRQQQHGRLLADRPSHRVHAGRPPAGHGEHRSRRRHARPGAGRRRACGYPDRARGRPARRHDIGAQRRRRRRLADHARVHRAVAGRRAGPLLGDRHLHAHRPVRSGRRHRCSRRPGRPRAGGGDRPSARRAGRLAVARRPQRLGPRSGDGRRTPVPGRSSSTSSGRGSHSTSAGGRGRSSRRSSWLGVGPRRLTLAPGGDGDGDRVGPRPASCPARRPLRARPPDVTAAHAARAPVRLRLGVVVVVRAPGKIVRRVSAIGLHVRRTGKARVLGLLLANRGTVTESVGGPCTVLWLHRRGRILAACGPSNAGSCPTRAAWSSSSIAARCGGDSRRRRRLRRPGSPHPLSRFVVRL